MNTTNKTILPASVTQNAVAKTLPPADALAVHELLNRVYLAEDTRDPLALRQLVTEDFVQVHSVFGELKGPSAFVEWVLSNPQLFDGIRHQAINTVTSSVSENRASAVGYIIVTQLFSDNESVASELPRIIGHGVVTDDLSKQDGFWRLQRRTYDQFSLLADFVPDADLRSRASQSVSNQGGV